MALQQWTLTGGAGTIPHRDTRRRDEEPAVRTWSTPAAAAISHARRGWAVTPLRPGTNSPAWKWARLTATPPGAVATWWPGPLYNPGIATGPSGLVVVDLDSAEHGGELPPEWASLGVTCGAEVLSVLAERAGSAIPATYEVRTPRNGRHLYFRHPGGREIRNSAGMAGPMVDVRGRGGLVVGAGSIRGGRAYELADGREPVPLPSWLAELAAPARDPVRTPARTAPAPGGRGYGAAALSAELAALADAEHGRRNDQLNRAAFSLGTLVGAGVLEQGDVARQLLDAAGAIGLVADDGPGQCERTIASGLAAGIARPRARRAA